MATKKKTSVKKKIVKKAIAEPVEEIVEIAEDVVETVLDTLEDNPEILATAKALQTARGCKTIAYLEYVLENRDELTEEYKRVKNLIKRYVK